MHPAASIIVFTTLSGLGYGLAAALGLGVLDPALISTKIAQVMALALVAAGLLSSTLHLGNPQRAWRALSQWRSSWLSREGVMALLTFVPLTAAAALELLEDRFFAPLGLLNVAMALATVYCTSMIYASLKSVQAWHTQLTPLCYVLFAAAGGFSFATLFAVVGATSVRPIAALAIVFLVAAWTAKLYWRNRMNTLRPISTPETATGLGFIGRVRLLERPHVNENYLTNEMGFRVARKHAAKLAWLSLLLGGLVPIVLFVIVFATDNAYSPLTVLAALVALLSHIAGVLVERWLFFAEARHAVMNYYGG